MRRQTYLLMLAAVVCAGGLQAQYSTTTVSTDPAGVEYYVDGQVYWKPVVFTWPTGSKHVVTFDPIQTGIVAGTRLSFSGWTDSTGTATQATSTLTITADPKITFYQAKFSAEYAVTLNFADCSAATSTPCATPGTILVGGQAYSSNAVVWVPANNPLTLQAIPGPGYVFVGWNTTFGADNQSPVIKMTITTPLVLAPRFSPAKQVTLVTSPPELQILLDRAAITTPQTMDLGVGTKHVLSAPDYQYDKNGNLWMLQAWSFGGAQNATYTVDSQANPPVTLTATFVPGVRASFLTNPAGLKLKIDGRDNWPAYTFIWAVGSTHTISGADQVDSKGRRYAFRSWSNASTATQNVVMDQNGASNGFRLTANFDLLGQLNISSAPLPVNVDVDGTSCQTPCVLDRPAGTQVRLSVPATIALSDSSRLDTPAWSDGGKGNRPFTFGGDVSSLAVNYQSSFRLTATANPVDAVDLRVDPPSADLFYPVNTPVTVNAVAKPGFKFRRWTGDLDGTYSVSTLSMGNPHTVTALADTVVYLPPSAVRNAAGDTPDQVVAPGSVVSIFGVHLATAYETGPATPLAQAIGGTAVRIGDRVLQLVFVSPEQINAVMPSDLPEGPVTLTVRAQGMPEASTSANLARNAPGLFGTTVDDTVFAAATHEDGSAITRDSPAKHGELVTLLGTGFGPYDSMPAEGFPVPATPLYSLVDTVDLRLGDTQVAADWCGAAPGLVGTTALRFRIGSDVAGGNIAVHVNINGRDSNTLVLPIEQ